MFEASVNKPIFRWTTSGFYDLGGAEGIAEIEVKLIVPPVVAVPHISEIVCEVAIIHKSEDEAEADERIPGTGEFEGLRRDVIPRAVAVAIGNLVLGGRFEHCYMWRQ